MVPGLGLIAVSFASVTGAGGRHRIWQGMFQHVSQLAAGKCGLLLTDEEEWNVRSISHGIYDISWQV